MNELNFVSFFHRSNLQSKFAFYRACLLISHISVLRKILLFDDELQLCLWAPNPLSINTSTIHTCSQFHFVVVCLRFFSFFLRIRVKSFATFLRARSLFLLFFGAMVCKVKSRGQSARQEKDISGDYFANFNPEFVTFLTHKTNTPKMSHFKEFSLDLNSWKVRSSAVGD